MFNGAKEVTKYANEMAPSVVGPVADLRVDVYPA